MLEKVDGLNLFLLTTDGHVLDEDDDFEQWADPLNKVLVSLPLEELDFLLSQLVHLSVDFLPQPWV